MTKRPSRLCCEFLFLYILSLCAIAYAEPISVTVDSKATGGFGPLLGGAGLEPDPSVQYLVNGTSFCSGQTLSVSATGEINANTNDPNSVLIDPDGIFSPAPRFNPNIYFPLEEAAVDAAELEIPTNLAVFNLGALMGAFVPKEIVNDAGFVPLNNDPSPDVINFGGVLPDPIIAGNIPSESLFLIGSGPIAFEAPEDGTLFLGVNDAFTPNNAGEFFVTIEADISEATVDIKPESDSNSINPKSNGNIPVAILTTDTGTGEPVDFDATQVDPLSARFGPGCATESHERGHVEDVDGDGDMDLVLHFNTQETEVACGDESLSLSAVTFSGDSIASRDAINSVGCN